MESKYTRTDTALLHINNGITITTFIFQPQLSVYNHNFHFYNHSFQFTITTVIFTETFIFPTTTSIFPTKTSIFPTTTFIFPTQLSFFQQFKFYRSHRFVKRHLPNQPNQTTIQVIIHKWNNYQVKELAFCLWHIPLVRTAGTGIASQIIQVYTQLSL